MHCRSRDVENSRRNDNEVARLLRGWIALAASTIVATTTILCYGIVQSEIVFSLLNAAVSDAATTDDDVQGEGDYYNDADEGGEADANGDENNRDEGHEERFLSEDNHDNEEHQEENAGAEDNGAQDDEVAYDDNDASAQTSSSFSLNVNMPKYSMDGTEVFFLAFMLGIVLLLLPYGRRILKDRKSLNSRFGIGLFSSALIMYANLSFLFSLLLSYSGEQLAGDIQEAYGDDNGLKPFSNIASPVCLVIAVAYLVFGAIIFDANPIFRPGAASKSLVEQQARSNKKLHYYVPRARDAWKAIQIFSILGLFVSFMVIVWCNNHSTVDCDENGYCQEVADEYSDSGMEVLCLYFSLFWAAILVVIFQRLGTEVFSGGSSNFLTGMFSGGLILLGCFFLGCFFFFAPFTWGGAALRQGSSDEGTYTFSYISLALAIFYGAFGGCVWYLHEAIVDAVFIGKDDTTIRYAMHASGSYDDTYGSAADTTFADGESTIRTMEQNNRLSSKRGPGGGDTVDDNTTAVSATVTESTVPIKNTRTSKQKIMPSLDEDSDGSYELV